MRSVLRAIPCGRAVACAGLAVAFVAAVGGCATPAGRAEAPARSAAAAMVHQPGSWDAVLPGPEVSATLPPWHRGWELGRRDGELGAREVRLATATDEWPRPGRPSLDRARRLHLPRRAETILYFGPERRPAHERPATWWP